MIELKEQRELRALDERILPKMREYVGELRKNRQLSSSSSDLEHLPPIEQAGKALRDQAQQIDSDARSWIIERKKHAYSDSVEPEK